MRKVTKKKKTTSNNNGNPQKITINFKKGKIISSVSTLYIKYVEFKTKSYAICKKLGKSGPHPGKKKEINKNFLRKNKHWD